MPSGREAIFLTIIPSGNFPLIIRCAATLPQSSTAFLTTILCADFRRIIRCVTALNRIGSHGPEQMPSLQRLTED